MSRWQNYRPAAVVVISTLLTLQPVHASSRWDLLRWCQAGEAVEAARCDGMLAAALDLTTNPDFTPAGLCFPPGTRLDRVRQAVVQWLNDDRLAVEKSGLALTARALTESYPCPATD